MNRYDELHDNGEHWHANVDGLYDYNLEQAVRVMQRHTGITQDGIFGEESLNDVVTFLKKYYSN